MIFPYFLHVRCKAFASAVDAMEKDLRALINGETGTHSRRATTLASAGKPLRSGQSEHMPTRWSRGGGNWNLNVNSNSMACFPICLGRFVKFGMVPDTPRIICDRIVKRRWCLNLRKHRTLEHMDCWKYYGSLESLTLTDHPCTPLVRLSRLLCTVFH